MAPTRRSTTAHPPGHELSIQAPPADARRGYDLGIEYDVFLADCPARTTLALVGNTWSVVVVFALGEGPRRYAELQARIGGISKKMLTQTLRRLERNGLVERRSLPGVPPRVEYRLTDLGFTLLEPVRSLSRWAEQHTDALLDAQAVASPA